MKQFISITIVLLLTMCSFICVNAKNGTTVYADKTVIEKNTLTLIPVKIKNNSGIMGYRITVKLTSEKLKMVSVKRGELSKSGNFNTSFGAKTDTFDVLWSGTEDMKEDGTLFVLGVKAEDYFDKQLIELSYNSKDTFNEKWGDVSFSCKNIEISCKKGAITTHKEPTVTEDKSDDSTYIALTDEQLIDGVQLTLEQTKTKSINSIKQDEELKFVEALNGNLQTMTDSEQTFYSTFRDVELNYNKAYKNYFVDKALNSVSNEKVKSAIEYALEKNNLKSISDLTEKNEQKVIKDVENNLKELNSDIPSISNDVDSDTAASAIKKLYGGLALTDGDEDYIPPENNAVSYTIIIALILVIVIIAVVGFIIIKRKNSKGVNSK